MRKLLITGAALLAACGDGTGPSLEGPLSIGQPVAVPAASRTTLNVEGGESGGEFVLIPFFADSFYVNPPDANGDRADTTTRKLSLMITATGTGAVTGPPTPALMPTDGAALLSRSASGGAATSELRPDERFHLALRGREQRAAGERLASLASMPASGGARLSRSALSSAAPVPAVGDILGYNTNARSACSSPDVRIGRVRAVTQRAIVLADTANPAGGFTDADYAQFAAQFDTLVYPLTTQHFGDPGDIDENSRSIIFFTRAVNELTEANSDSYVGGFFYGRDLFPVAPSGTYPGCLGSNEAEILYMLVPDPTGAVNGNVRTTDFVRSVTTGVLAHEVQHLINLSKRFVNGASIDEDVWLNEGLSHVAEELMFYRASGLQPRTNITLSQIAVGSQYATVFSSYQAANINRLNRYYRNPEGNSPYADNDSLSTRGSTWQLLRYLTDRRGGDQTVTLKRLVNTRLSGLRNIQDVFGGDGLALVRDYTVAVYADDAEILASNVSNRYNQPSWNYRAIYRSCQASSSQCPLVTRPLTANGVVVTLVGGGASFLRFSVAPNTTAVITTNVAGSGSAPAVTQVPSTLQMTLLRTK